MQMYMNSRVISVICFILVLNNGCSIYGIDSEQNTLLSIICRLCRVTFTGHVYFLHIIAICK